MNNRQVMNRGKRVFSANNMIFLSVGLYTLLRVFSLLIKGENTMWITALIMGGSIELILIFINVKYSQSHLVMFIIPFIIMIGLIVSALINGGNDYIFTAFVCVSAMTIMYFNYRSMRIFIILTNCIFFFLIFGLKMDIMGSLQDHNDVVMHYIINNIGVIFLFFVCRASSKQYHQSSQAQNYFITMMDTTPNIVALVDNQHKVNYISQPLAKAAFIENSALVVGRPIIDLFHSTQMKLVVANALSSDDCYENTVEIWENDTKYWYKVVSNKMHGQASGRLIDIIDVTPIMEAKISAENATRAKSVFLANMSHEIRTPMNAIVGMADLLSVSNLSQEQKSQVEHIKNASESLLRIINDVLDFSKIESNKMEIISRPFDIASLFYDAINMINIHAAGNNLDFVALLSKNIPAILITDEMRLKQILINLLNNAVKFTKAGYVKLTVDCTYINAQTVRLEFHIEDTGIGIREEDLPKIFLEFTQADIMRNHNIIGTGLGLPISKHLIELMGGTICVQSTYEKGTDIFFSITCPYQESNPIAAVSTPEQKSALFYEPNAEFAGAIAIMCQDFNLSYSICDSRAEFVRRAYEQEFTHIFFEYQKGYPVVKTHIDQFMKSNLIAMKNLRETYNEDSLPSRVQSLSKPLLVTPLARVLNNLTPHEEKVESSSRIGFFTTQNVRILVVDDHSVNLTVAHELLKKYNVQTDLCESGAHAIRMVKQIDYDLVFMDHMMPEMNGIDATRAIRALGGLYEEVPIIALSANAIYGMRNVFRDAGMNDFLPKPISIKQLNRMLLAYLPPEKIIMQDEVDDDLTDTNGDAKLLLSLQEISQMDVELGLAHIGGSVESYLMILRNFLAISDTKLTLMQKYFTTKAWKPLSIEVHAIKSVLMQIGVQQLSDDARDLEAAMMQMRIEFVKAKFPTFFHAVSLFMEEFRAALLPSIQEQEDKKPKEMGSHKELLEKIQMIFDHLQTLNRDGALEIINGLKLHRFSEYHEKMLSLLHNAMEVFDYDLAEQTCQTLLTDDGKDGVANEAASQCDGRSENMGIR